MKQLENIKPLLESRQGLKGNNNVKTEAQGGEGMALGSLGPTPVTLGFRRPTRSPLARGQARLVGPLIPSPYAYRKTEVLRASGAWPNHAPLPAWRRERPPLTPQRREVSQLQTSIAPSLTSAAEN